MINASFRAHATSLTTMASLSSKATTVTPAWVELCGLELTISQWKKMDRCGCTATDYTRAQLDASVYCLLSASFDDEGGELVESVNQIAFPVESIISFGCVLSTKHHSTLIFAKSLPVDGCCHSGDSFVDEELGGKWKLVKSNRSGATAMDSELPRLRARTVVR